MAAPYADMQLGLSANPVAAHQLSREADRGRALFRGAVVRKRERQRCGGTRGAFSAGSQHEEPSGTSGSANSSSSL